VALASAIGACSSTLETIGEVNLLPRIDRIAKPDWLTYSGGRQEFALRPVGPDDLVGAEGQCPVTPEQAAAAQAAAAENQNLGAGAPRESAPESPPQVALVQGGIALQMTECDVIRRAGAPERLEFGTNERGERTVVITYVRGVRPGIYRFAGGRLYSIERAPEPPPSARPKKSRPAKKPARV
jgi:hypothetical protein